MAKKGLNWSEVTDADLLNRKAVAARMNCSLQAVSLERKRRKLRVLMAQRGQTRRPSTEMATYLADVGDGLVKAGFTHFAPERMKALKAVRAVWCSGSCERMLLRALVRAKFPVVRGRELFRGVWEAAVLIFWTLVHRVRKCYDSWGWQTYRLKMWSKTG